MEFHLLEGLRILCENNQQLGRVFAFAYVLVSDLALHLILTLCHSSDNVFRNEF